MSNVPTLDEMVGATIRAELARRRLTATNAAVPLKRTRQYVSRRLTGELSFTLADLNGIAHFLGISLTSLLPDSASKAA
ncbi:hypothetical protein [Mycobacteroides abscessus]|uniref:hypothetical protein n=1 Tax=Mycobacteroides abscessus TaxID=36809 RepID=UPI00103D2589|nr:hypothetical protein [Mycobacteroides abscessus]